MSAYTTREAATAELPAVLTVQRDAFRRVAAELHIDPAHLPPLSETLEDLRSLHASGTRFFAAFDETGELIGAVRGSLVGGTVEIGRLVVSDAWVRRRVATAVMDLLEASYPNAKRFELFTGVEAHAALALYAKRGYTPYRREPTPATELVWLEKIRPSAVG